MIFGAVVCGFLTSVGLFLQARSMLGWGRRGVAFLTKYAGIVMFLMLVHWADRALLVPICVGFLAAFLVGIGGAVLARRFYLR